MSFETMEALPLQREVEEGCVEYKYKLTDLSHEQIQHRVTQLMWRLKEGGGEAVYEIGVEDSGHPLGLSAEDLSQSLHALEDIAAKAGGSCEVRAVMQGVSGLVAEVLVRKERKVSLALTASIALAGDFDCGKSTLLAFLAHGAKDNGRGSSRRLVLQHNHELSSGRTSSVAQLTLHFDRSGALMNDREGMGLRAEEVSLEAARTVSFMDLAGHSKYLRTTLQGLVARGPNVCLLCISARRGVQPMTTEHLGVAFALRIKLAIVVTKIDLVTQEAIDSLLDNIRKLLLSGRKKILLIENVDSVDSFVNKIEVNKTESAIEEFNTTVPIFLTSSVTGSGIDALKRYCFALPNMIARHKCQTKIKEELEMKKEIKENNVIEEKFVKTCARAVGSFTVAKQVINVTTSDTEHKSKINKKFASVQHQCSSTFSSPLISARSESFGGSFKTIASSSNLSNFHQSNLSQSYQSSFKSQKGGLDFNSKSRSHQDAPAEEFQTVFLMSIHSGAVSVGAEYLFGPVNVRGEFCAARVKSVRVDDVPCLRAAGGQTATVVLSRIPTQNPAKSSKSQMVHKASEKSNIKLEKEKENESYINDDENMPPPIFKRNRSLTLSSLHCEKSSIDSTDKVDSSVKVEDIESSFANSGTENVSNVNLECWDSILSLGPTSTSGERSRRRTVPGLVLLSVPDLNLDDTPDGLATADYPSACWEFEAEILILNHPGEVRVGYEPVVLIGGVEQSARITAIAGSRANGLVNGCKALCRFRFVYQPEFLSEGAAVLLREGRIRAVGHVAKTFNNIF